MREFRDGAPPERARFVDTLITAYRAVGFVAIKHHGLPEDRMGAMHRAIQRFFARSSEFKRQYERPELGRQVGYTSLGVEIAAGAKEHDLKEFWQARHPTKPSSYGSNLVPEGIEEWDALGQVYLAMEEFSLDILSAVAVGLDIPERYFDKMCRGGDSLIRAIHYPPVKGTPSAFRAGAHGDINMNTTLAAKKWEPGLQILAPLVGVGSDAIRELESLLRRQDSERVSNWAETHIPEPDVKRVSNLLLGGRYESGGVWIDAEIPKDLDCVVENVGDMLQESTGGLLRSVIHRVVNPAATGGPNVARFSTPFFGHPVYDNPEITLTIDPTSPGRLPRTALDERLIAINCLDPEDPNAITDERLRRLHANCRDAQVLDRISNLRRLQL